jgi:hypothetical protein
VDETPGALLREKGWRCGGKEARVRRRSARLDGAARSTPATEDDGGAAASDTGCRRREFSYPGTRWVPPRSQIGRQRRPTLSMTDGSTCDSDFRIQIADS